MSRDDEYLQFPLCLLSMTSSKNELYKIIEDYAYINFGLKFLPKIDEKIISDYKERVEFIYGEHREELTAGILGQQVIWSGNNQIYCNNLKVDNYFKACQYIIKFESEYGKDALVRLRKNIISLLKSGEMSERNFRILTSIYSVIGNKDYSSVTYEQIRYRMFGFKKRNIFEIEKQNNPKIKLLTHRKIGTTVKKLEIQGWFTSCRPFNRKKYYSNRMDFETLYNRITRKEDAWTKLQKKKKMIMKKGSI